MHFIILGIGVLIGLYGLYRFFLVANLRQITAFFLVAGFVMACITIFFLAISGRLPAAIGGIIALLPILLPLLKKKRQPAVDQSWESHEDRSTKTEKSGPMTRREALEILGLEDPVTDEDVKAAYKKLIRKVHPDQEGSPWMATKLNQARDILLKAH